MRVCLDIEFAHKIVCILGGGNVAYRKAKQFSEANANVYVYSLQYLEAFKELDVQMVDYEELLATLEKATLAIACTDNQQVNQEFLTFAQAHHVLTMAAQSAWSQDTFSMSSLRKEHLLLACNTQGAFPLANSLILEQMNQRLGFLQEIRTHIHDHSLCKDLVFLNDEQLQFLCSVIGKKGIVYLLHGSNDFLAKRQCDHLVEQVEMASYFFLAKKCIAMPFKRYCQLLKELQAEVTFYFLFWDPTASYVKNAGHILDQMQFPYHFIHINPQDVVEDQTNVILHTNDEQEGVVVTMVYSSFMKKKHPKCRYVCALDNERIIERIIDETNKNY